MAARDQVKTMVPEAHSTLDAHPKNNKEKLHSFFLLLANTKSQATYFVAYDWSSY